MVVKLSAEQGGCDGSRQRNAGYGSFCGVCQRADEGGWACGPGGTAAGLLLWAFGDGRASQRRADGGGDGAGAGFGTASEAAAFRCQCGMVGRADAGQGARPGDAVDDAAG